MLDVDLKFRGFSLGIFLNLSTEGEMLIKRGLFDLVKEAKIG